MAKHKFDGDWRYYDMGVDNFPPTEELFKLVIPEDDGKLKPGSKKKHNLTGEAGANTIVMNEHDGKALVNVDYEGSLVFEDGDRFVLIGKWVDNEAKARKRKGEDLDGQEEGTWVGMKP